MIGPVFGSIFYHYFGYAGAFSIFAGLLGIAWIISFVTLSENQILNLDFQDEEEIAISHIAELKVPYRWFFSNLRTIFGLITCTYVCLIFSFHASFFTSALQSEKGVDEYYHGLIVCI